MPKNDEDNRNLNEILEDFKDLKQVIMMKIQTNTPLTQRELAYPYFWHWKSELETQCEKFNNDVSKTIKDLLSIGKY